MEENLILVTTEDESVHIPISHIESIKAFNAVNSNDIGGVPIATGSYQCIEIKTSTDNIHKIIRNPENDRQILTFMLSNGKNSA